MNGTDAYQIELKERNKRQKIYDAIVEGAMGRVLASVRRSKPPIASHLFFGAMGIHPKHLSSWYIFLTDEEWNEAKENGLIDSVVQKTLAELEDGGYPAEVLSVIYVSFASEETIEKQGGYLAFFK